MKNSNLRLNNKTNFTEFNPLVRSDGFPSFSRTYFVRRFSWGEIFDRFICLSFYVEAIQAKQNDFDCSNDQFKKLDLLVFITDLIQSCSELFRRISQLCTWDCKLVSNLWHFGWEDDLHSLTRIIDMLPSFINNLWFYFIAAPVDLG